MYKSIRARVIACLSVVALLSLSVLPLMANAEEPLSGDPWGTSSTTFSEPITVGNKNWIATNELQLILDIVYDAYRGGMFGGAYPYAIGLVHAPVTDGQSEGFTLCVYTVNHSPYETASPGFSHSDFFDNPATAFNISAGSTSITFSASWMPALSVQYASFVLSSTGNFIIADFSDNSASFTANSPLIAINNRIKPKIDGATMTTNEIIAGGQSWSYVDTKTTSPSQAIMRVRAHPLASLAPADFGATLENILHAVAVNGSVFDDGYNDGYDDGHDEGVLSGYQTGYNQGLTEGETIGYDNGYADGFSDGESTGYADGFTDGEANGYVNGYHDGYADGTAPVVLDIPSIFTAMFYGVHSIFQGFDINIFGISIAGMLLGILLVAVVTFIVKKIK